MNKIVKSAALAVGTLALAAPAAAQFGGPPNPNLGAPLWAANVPADLKSPVFYADLGQGGPSGFTGVLDEASNRLCYMLSVPGIDDTTAAHIHTGGPGETGAPLVTLKAPAGGSSGDCLTLQADVARSLLANPGGYYVNVHTSLFPAGATRGQLNVRLFEG